MKTVAVIFLVLISVKSFSQNDLKKTNQMKKVSLTNEGTIKVQAHNKGQYVSSDNKKIIEAKTVAYYDSYISSIKTKMKHIKADEVGIIECAKIHDKPFHTYSVDELTTVESLLQTPSDYVFNTVGVYGVAESAALYSAKKSTNSVPELILSKQKNTKATCAIARAYLSD